MSKYKGSFTLPGEAGYEELTLQLARKWGADVIRDSDGTELSPEILNSGHGIYSTICLIREHNEWGQNHRNMLQQTFLVTRPVMAVTGALSITILDDFFEEQFEINDSVESLGYWQVFDRTADMEISSEKWIYEAQSECVKISNAVPYHSYTVSFLAYRKWEEISMYNHVTNNWNKEHLLQLDPRYPEVQKYLLEWMEKWCVSHPYTTVVRFTSLFYNFAWIWGQDTRNRHLFTDWGSYDFSVSLIALQLFEKEHGFRLQAEDFVNQGKYQTSHMPAVRHKREWIDFTNRFVLGFAKKLIEIVHKYQKKAYVFYDDSWIGLEPHKENFAQFGFDGLIKCVFSGFETRMCAGVEVPIHEIRLHPYLFPVGLGGAPTFMEGGNPTQDAKQYWINVRRALLREPIERIGLGGYLHLTEAFPDFQDCIEEISDEFRIVKSCHIGGKPFTTGIKIAVLHYWGSFRAWTLSGHFHETVGHDLIHILEALAGLPFEVEFIDFEDVKSGKLKNYDVVINAGSAGTAWSGGSEWESPEVVTRLKQWTYEGGLFLGVNEPSALDGYFHFFRMAEVLGVDKDIPAKSSHGKWKFETVQPMELFPEGSFIPLHARVSLIDGAAKVLASQGEAILLSLHKFGAGCGVYLSGYEYSIENTRMLLNILMSETKSKCRMYITDNSFVECAYYPHNKTLIAINNSNQEQLANIETETGLETLTIEAYGHALLQIM